MPNLPDDHARGLKHLTRRARIARDQRVEITMVLRRRDEVGFQQHLARVHRRTATPLARGAFAARFGALPEDVATITQFATAQGLVVIETALSRRSVMLSGSAEQLERAFGITLYHYAYDSGTCRSFEGGLQMPAQLKDCVMAVLGLDSRPQARPHFRRAASADVSYTPLEIASRYGFPAGDGSGQCIAIIELGGGYQPLDLSTYFSALGLSEPDITAISVDGASNRPTGSAEGPDGEVMLDIEVAGAIAPKAKLAVYFAPNTDAGFLNAITTAVHDTHEQPTVVSISWGGPESSYTQSALQAMDAALADAVAMGLTVCIAAGDNGASDGVAGGTEAVDFPASSPHALACGGTRLNAQSETVWNDGSSGGATGGGVSQVFAAPAYQAGLAATTSAGVTSTLTMRGVPDVAGNADPQTGYQVRVDGTQSVIGGTSAVAPLWAGLIARLNALQSRALGFLPPLLYAHPDALNDIVSGDNQGFTATPGWDACTGLGSPNGAVLATLTAPPPSP